MKEALEKNFDVGIAAARVLEARAQFGVSRSALLPTVDARGQFNANRNSSVGQFVFVPRGTAHTVWVSGDGPVRGLIIISPGDAAHEFVPVEAA